MNGFLLFLRVVIGKWWRCWASVVEEKLLKEDEEEVRLWKEIVGLLGLVKRFCFAIVKILILPIRRV